MVNESEFNRTPESPPVQIKTPPESPGNKEPLEVTQILPGEEQIKVNSKAVIENLENIISDIDNSQIIKENILQNNLDKLCDVDLSVSDTLSQTADTLQSINVIKDELCKLPLDTCEMEFITNNINPLLNILYQLSTTSYNLAGSTNLLSISSTLKPKRSDLKDTVKLVYKINDECEDVYDVLKRRINFILENKK